MSSYHDNYIDNSVFVYDVDGNNLLHTTIVGHEKVEMRIMLEQWSPDLKIGDLCKLLIIAEPSPREYHGRVRSDFGNMYIALFRGKEKESRDATRYKINIMAQIEKLIYDEQEYVMHEPVNIQLINISTSGMRFRAQLNTINLNDKFKTTMIINDKPKVLFAQVVNMKEADDKYLEYGCRFLQSTDN